MWYFRNLNDFKFVAGNSKMVNLISDPNKVFIAALLFFIVDCVVNFFINAPVFVVFAIFFLPAIGFCFWVKGQFDRPLLIFIFSFLVVSLIGNIVYGYHRTNISNLVFILLFISGYYLYYKNAEKLKIGIVHLFLIISLSLFSFAFAGYHSGQFGQGHHVTFKTISPNEKKVKHAYNKLDKVEDDRNYNYGLFRVPHIGAYFFGFLTLFYGFLFLQKKKWYYFLLAVLLFSLMMYSGVRTFIIAALMSLVIFLIRRKTIFYFIGLLVAGIFAIAFRNEIFALTEDTFLQPFSALLVTFADNFGRFSRVLIWRSWWLEVSQFAWYDFLIGKTFYSGLFANYNNLRFSIWFHNDLLSIFYTHGLIPLVLYLWFIFKIYRDHATLIRGNIFLFLFYFSIIITMLINGFYYFFPIFLMYVFLVMINIEKERIKAESLQ